jgi:hypothetical protein
MARAIFKAPLFFAPDGEDPIVNSESHEPSRAASSDMLLLESSPVPPLHGEPAVLLLERSPVLPLREALREEHPMLLLGPSPGLPSPQQKLRPKAISSYQ